MLDSCRRLGLDGFDITYLPVESNGLIDLEKLESEIRDDTAVVSVMTVNNEIGVVQPVKEIGEICRKKKVFFHTDAAQAVGKIPINVDDMNIDIMSISGHKVSTSFTRMDQLLTVHCQMYGPKGIGAIYVRRRPRVRMEPIINGGGQERGLRSGTLPTALCVGLGAASEVCGEEMEADHEWITHLSHRLSNGLTSQVILFGFIFV